MITDKEYFIKIAGILAHSDIDENNCKYIIDFIIKQNSEIERLNNILNHLEKELKDIQDKYIIEKEQTDNQYHYDLCNARIYAYQDILDKLKELKENNNDKIKM